MIGLAYRHAISRDKPAERWDVYCAKGNAAVVQASRDGTCLAYARKDHVIEFWDTSTVPVALCALPALPVLAGFGISLMCFSDDGTHLGVVASTMNTTAKTGTAAAMRQTMQIFLCRLPSSLLPSGGIVSFANVALPFSVPTCMSFWGSGNSALILGGASKGRFVFTAGQLRELYVDVASGSITFGSESVGTFESAATAVAAATAAAAASSSSSESSSSVSSRGTTFAVHGNSLFLIEGVTLFEYSLSVSASSSSPSSSSSSSSSSYFSLPERPKLVVAHHSLFSGDKTRSLTLLPRRCGSAHLMVVSNQTNVRVLTLSGQTILRYSYTLCQALKGQGWLNGFSEGDGSGWLMLVMRNVANGSHRLVFINAQDGKAKEHHEWGRAIMHKGFCVCTSSPNPYRLFAVYGVDTRDYCWALHSRFKSDFPGPMYPVAFQLIKQGITYVEREDELDLSVNGQVTRTVVDKDPFTEIKPATVRLDIGSSFRSPVPTPSLGIAWFDDKRLRFGSGGELSAPVPQTDMLSAWAGPRHAGQGGSTVNAKKALQDMGAAEDDDDETLSGGMSGSAAAAAAGGSLFSQFLRPPERVVTGEFHRKLSTTLKHGDELVRICNDDVNYTVDALEHLVPVLPELPKQLAGGKRPLTEDANAPA